MEILWPMTLKLLKNTGGLGVELFNLTKVDAPYLPTPLG